MSATTTDVASGRRRGFARLAAAVVAAALALAAVPAGAAGAIESLERFLSSTPRASGTFVQTVAGERGAAERSEGRFAFERPGTFRWEVTEPYEQLMVADGHQVWFYDRDLEQVTVRPLAEAMGATPAAILFGSGSLDDDFVVADAGERDGLAWLEATPRRSDAGFERIRIGFERSLPAAMEVDDAFGRTVRFRFGSVDVSPDFPPGHFRFEPPAGADVIRQ